MNIFKKKKHEEPVSTPPPTSPSRASNRGSSVNGINIPPRTNSGPIAVNQQQGQGQGQNQGNLNTNMNNGSNASNIGNINMNSSGNSPRNNQMEQQQQLQMQQQQQQQYYQQQQQHQYQQQQGNQQPYLQPHPRDSDSGSMNNGMHGHQNQGLQPGSYGNDSLLTSQPIQLPYQHQDGGYNNNNNSNNGYNQGNNGGMDDGYNNGGMGYSMDDEQQMQQQQYMQQMHNNDDMSGNNNNNNMNNGQDGYYNQSDMNINNNNNNGNNNYHQGSYDGGYDGSNSMNMLTSGVLNMSGLGNGNNNNDNNNYNNNYQNGHDNSNNNNQVMNSGNNNNSANNINNGNGNGLPNSGKLSNNGSGDLALSSDVRKLQDEVQSWKKSQESSQAKITQLRQTLTQKSQENRDLHQSLSQVTQDRLMLQELVHKREKEMDDLRSKYLNDVRQIRATDDDHSTIEQRVRMLQAAILQLTKSSSGDRAVNLNLEGAQLLVKKKYKFGNTQPYILNMFLEKYIMDSLLEEVFHAKFYVGFQMALEYDNIHQWMVENNFQDQAVRFRQQLCFLSAKSPTAQTYANQEAGRIAASFEEKLERLYNNWNGHQKVLDLVTKAIELSLTMRSQNAEIIARVIPADTEFDPETMVPAHKSKDGGLVKVCVMPCFVDTNGVVVGKAKVFCG